ncbi:MAG: hypothetical protein SFY68_13360 [Candidatus Sumerlaeia bacterium]|nr:hypothetical protein [Candidatus Sumerlaeia bacterium]
MRIINNTLQAIILLFSFVFRFFFNYKLYSRFCRFDYKIYYLISKSCNVTRFYCVTLGFFCTGCAVHYYEEETGVEHLIGFGHMKMKAIEPNEGVQGVVHGSESFGLSLGKANRQTFTTLGWQRMENVDIIQESTSIRIEYPSSSFYDVRIGSKFPIYPKQTQGVLPLELHNNDIQID